METIAYLLPPIIASCFGVLFIVCSKKISHFLQDFWERFPKYDKTIFENISIKPIYVVTLGATYTVVAVLSFFERLKEIL